MNARNIMPCARTSSRSKQDYLFRWGRWSETCWQLGARTLRGAVAPLTELVLPGERRSELRVCGNPQKLTAQQLSRHTVARGRGSALAFKEGWTPLRRSRGQLGSVGWERPRLKARGRGGRCSQFRLNSSTGCPYAGKALTRERERDRERESEREGGRERETERERERDI